MEKTCSFSKVFVYVLTAVFQCCVIAFHDGSYRDSYAAELDKAGRRSFRFKGEQFYCRWSLDTAFHEHTMHGFLG